MDAHFSGSVLYYQRERDRVNRELDSGGLKEKKHDKLLPKHDRMANLSQEEMSDFAKNPHVTALREMPNKLFNKL